MFQIQNAVMYVAVYSWTNEEPPLITSQEGEEVKTMECGRRSRQWNVGRGQDMEITGIPEVKEMEHYCGGTSGHHTTTASSIELAITIEVEDAEGSAEREMDDKETIVEEKLSIKNTPTQRAQIGFCFRLQYKASCKSQLE